MLDYIASPEAIYGLIFPVYDSDKTIVATPPLTLPMGWKNLPPLFCTATETVTDLANQTLCAHAPLRPHMLDGRVAAVASSADHTLDPTVVTLSQDTLLLRTNAQLLAYVEIFVDDFIGLAQGPTQRCYHVRRTFFHILDKVFRPLENTDPTQRKELL